MTISKSWYKTKALEKALETACYICARVVAEEIYQKIPMCLDCKHRWCEPVTVIALEAPRIVPIVDPDKQPGFELHWK